MTFAQASKAWLDEWSAERRLNSRLCVQIYLHFSREHFERTGELLAWPKWNRLVARTGLSRRTIAEGLRKFEQAGALEIEHGRYNHEKKKRDVNLYRGKTKVQSAAPSKQKQGAVFDQNQGAVGPTRLCESDSVNLSKNLNLESEEGRKGSLPSEATKPFLPINPLPPNSARPPSPEFRWRQERVEAQATLERYRAAALAVNGGGLAAGSSL
jgi:hypothetical protein